MKILGVMWMKIKLSDREIWEYEIIDIVNVQNFLFQLITVVEQVYTQEFFKTEEVPRNKAISRNISATTRKQEASWEKNWGFFT